MSLLFDVTMIKEGHWAHPPFNNDIAVFFNYMVLVLSTEVLLKEWGDRACKGALKTLSAEV